MRVKVDEPALLPELLRFLEGRVDFITFEVGVTEVEISVLGSFAHRTRAELEAHLESWRTLHGDVAAVCEPDTAPCAGGPLG